MNNQHKSKEELINELTALQQAYTLLQSASEQQLVAHRLHEEELRASEKEFRALIEFSPVAMTVIHDWKSIYFNPAAVQLLGATTQNEILGKPILDFVHPDFHGLVMENAASLAIKGYVDLQEQQYVRLDGTLLDVETQAKSIRFNGAPATLVVMNDITERKKTEIALRESEERFKALHNASFGGIAIHENGKILECNQGLSQITGYTYDELLTMDGLQLIAPSSREMVLANILTGYEKPYEALGIRKNGEVYPLRIEASNVPYKGKSVRTVEFRDITESKQMESELQKIEWLLRPKDVVQEMYEPVYGDITKLNRDGIILKALGNASLKNIANDFMSLLETSCAIYEQNGDYAMGIFSSGWCRFMDISSYEQCGTGDVKSALSCGKWHCHESCWNDASKKAMSTGMPVDIECNGGIHLYAVPIFSDQKIIGVINFGYGNPPQDKETIDELARKYQVDATMLHQISREYKTRPQYIIDLAKHRLTGAAELIGLLVQRHRVEKELRIAKEKAEESDRLKSAFLANMSHEIRTPMNGILGFAELLKEPELTGEEQQEYVRIIEKSGARMLNILNDIIDISKIEAGLMKVNIMESNINAQIKYISTFFNPEVEAKGMTLRVNTPLPDNEVRLKTDPEKVYAILTNLVKNAIKYSLKGFIEVGYKLKIENGPVELEIYVKDTGIGIPKDRQEAVFERFIQAGIADKMARQGAGLGLSIAKAYVGLLGGKIRVESLEGVGSTFYFTLPYITENHIISQQI